MDQHESTTTPERSVLGRRTILKGAAWSVPAVLAVGATPAFAASNLALSSGLLRVRRRGGNVRYEWTATNENDPGTSILITDIQFSSAGSYLTEVLPTNAIAGGSSSPVIPFTGSYSTSTTTTLPAFEFTVSYLRGPAGEPSTTWTSLTRTWSVPAVDLSNNNTWVTIWTSA